MSRRTGATASSAPTRTLRSACFPRRTDDDIAAARAVGERPDHHHAGRRDAGRGCRLHRAARPPPPPPARTSVPGRPPRAPAEPNSGRDIKPPRRLAGLGKDICKESGKPAIIAAPHFENLPPLAARVLLVDTRQRTIRTLA